MQDKRKSVGRGRDAVQRRRPVMEQCCSMRSSSLCCSVVVLREAEAVVYKCLYVKITARNEQRSCTADSLFTMFKVDGVEVWKKSSRRGAINNKNALARISEKIDVVRS